MSWPGRPSPSVTMRYRGDTALIDRLNEPDGDENALLFLADVDSPSEHVRLAQTLLAGARIPSLLVHGIMLQGDAQTAPVSTMLAVHNGEDWLLFDPQTGHLGRPEAPAPT